MADVLEKADTASEEEYSKPNPQINPRNISINEIASRVAEQHKTDFAETAPVVNDEGQPAEPMEAAPEEAPAEEEAPAQEAAPEPAAAAPAAPEPGREPIDPVKEYEVTIDGQKIKVPGQKIIDAGFRTYQKETAADYRLQVATELMRKAEEQAKAATLQTGAAQPATTQQASEMSDTELAQAIQYGSPDDAAKAVAEMRKRNTVDPAQIVNIVTAQVRSETAFQEGLKFVQTEYADLLASDVIRRMFFLEENRRRAPKEQGGEGDQRPHKELYQAIGEHLRKELNRPKPATGTTQGPPIVASTTASRQERKAAAPSVPRTAAGRLSGNQEGPKVKSTSEIIAAMAARRGQGQLTQRKE